MYQITRQHATETSDKLIDHFTGYSFPEIIVSDNRTKFYSKVIKKLIDLHKLKIQFVSTQHSPSNGHCERVHFTLFEHIRLLNNQPEFRTDTIIKKVKYEVIVYNNTNYSDTKLTTIEIF